MDGKADIRVSLKIVHLLPTTFYPWCESAREKKRRAKSRPPIMPVKTEGFSSNYRRTKNHRHPAWRLMRFRRSWHRNFKQVVSAVLLPLALGSTAPHELALQGSRPSGQQRAAPKSRRWE
jgi:hypothetical protein